MLKNWFKKSKNKSTQDKEDANLSKNTYRTDKNIKTNPHKIEIHTYDEVVYVLRLFATQNKIILNLVNTPSDERKRIVDFLSGYIYAKKGTVKLSGSHIYIFSLEQK